VYTCSQQDPEIFALEPDAFGVTSDDGGGPTSAHTMHGGGGEGGKGGSYTTAGGNMQMVSSAGLSANGVDSRRPPPTATAVPIEPTPRLAGRCGEARGGGAALAKEASVELSFASFVDMNDAVLKDFKVLGWKVYA